MLLLAVSIAIAMIVLVATMVFLVPAGTERVRRRGDGDVDSQGAELTPEDRSS